MSSKTILIINLFLATTAGVAYCSTASLESANNSGLKMRGASGFESSYDPLANIAWIQKYPQLAGIESNNQTAVIDKLRTSESISQLIGPITNAYGVRDDILDYIIQNVPESNLKLLQAVIIMSYYNNLSSFSANNEEKLLFSRKSSLAMHCVYLANKKSAHYLIQAIDKKERNTSDRALYQNNLDQNVFAWQTLGSGYGSNTEDEMCNSGEYLK